MSRPKDWETTEDLDARAVRLRNALREEIQRPKAFVPAWAGRVSAISLISLTLAVSVWLVVSQEAREALLQQFVKEDLTAQASTVTIRDVSASQGGAPEVSRERVRSFQPVESPPKVTPREQPARDRRRAPEQPKPRLERDGQPVGEVPAARSQAKSETPPSPPPVLQPQASQANGSAAYDLVLSTRAKMRELVSQGAARWHVVKDENSVVWIDIVIAREGEEHYIWAVNLQKRTVEPLSRAARNLGG